MWFKLYHRWNCCHTGYISTWFYISFIIHLIWISNKQYHYNHHCSSRKWQRAIFFCVFCCITIFIQLRRSVVFIDLFYIINRLLEHNINIFCRYNSKEGRFNYCLGAKIVPTIQLVLFLMYLNYLNISYWLFIYIKFCFFFRTSDSMPILFVDTAYRCWSSRKWQREIIICFVCCITIFIQLWSYIVVINLFYIINCLLGRNLYRFFRRNRKEGKSIFCFVGKLVPTIRMILFLV